MSNTNVRPAITSPALHRYAMVALACAGEPRFEPSLLEAPTAAGRPQYTIQTVRAARRVLRARDRLFFLIGVDAFLDLPHWKDCRPSPRPRLGGLAQPNEIRLRKTTLHILRGVDMRVASRDIREALAAAAAIGGLVPAVVEEYIRKEALYRSR